VLFALTGRGWTTSFPSSPTSSSDSKVSLVLLKIDADFIIQAEPTPAKRNVAR
jgi:hypothetical protein